jgi:ABC-2 type transport system permease protein
MARLWTVIKREYLERVRSKWFLIATVFGPLFFGALMIVPAWLSIRSARSTEHGSVVIIDATGTRLGDRVADRLRGGLFSADTTVARVERVAPSAVAQAESSATRAVMRKEVGGFLVLPPTVMRDTSVRYAGNNAASITEVDRIERAVRDAIVAVRLEDQGVDPEAVQRVMKIAMSVQPEQITERGRGGSGRVRFIFAASVALVLYMTILVHGQNILRSVLEEKTTRVAEVVVASVRPETLLAGKIIGVGGVAVTQVVTWIIASMLLLKVRAPISAALGLPAIPLSLPSVTPGVLILLVVFFLLGFLLFSALYAIVGAMVTSEQEAQQAQQPLLLIVFSPLFLLQAILLNPLTPLARTASIIPFAAPVLMPLRLSLVSVPTRDIALSLAVNLVACVVAMWLASRVYRVGILMYGKRASLAEVARWVRQR